MVRKRKINYGLDQVQAFDACSESGSPGDSFTFNAPLFLYWAQTLFYLTTSWVASDLISTTFCMHMV